MLNPIRAAILISKMKINQWKSREELEELQQRRLDKLLKYASEEVPGYGGYAGKLLADLPVIGKMEISSGRESYIGRRFNREKLTMIKTSGSTGRPTETYYDSADGLYASVLRYHQLTECGFGPMDSMSEIMYSKEPKNILQKMGIYRINHATPVEPVDEVYNHLLRRRPDFVLAYPSTMAIASIINNRNAKKVRLRGVFCQSEVLHQSTREAIMDSFGAYVRNSYSSNETRNIAWECEEGSMHINSDSIIVEVLDDENQPVRGGKSGHLVVTPLWRYSMPFIRYRIGDTGSLGGKCRCGRGTHILKSIDGRDNDIVIGPSGEGVSPARIELAIGLNKEIIQYQVRQEERGKITVLAISSKKVEPKELAAKIEKKLDGMSVDVEIVDSIPRTKNGKVKCVFSTLKLGD